MRFWFWKPLGFVFAVCLLVGSPWDGKLFAQNVSADILGTVTDSSGAIVPNAKITVQNLDTHQTRITTSNGSGDYTFNLLPPGNWSVRVEAPGFKTFQIASLTLSVGDRARADAPMQIGSTGETVEVTAQTPALQTDSSTLTNTLGESSVQELPLNGRNYVTLVQTTPGANSGPPASILSGTHPDERRQSASVSANGQPEGRNNNEIDGMDNNEREQGLILVRPSIDEIQEVAITTNSYTADQGYTSGAVVNIITKSGSNKFHGTAYEYFRNDILDANEFFNNYNSSTGKPNKRPVLRQNQFGGSLGGFIFRDKTFFFGDYEGLRVVKGQSSGVQSVPTQYEHDHVSASGADFTDQCATGRLASITTSTGTVIKNGDPSFAAACNTALKFSANQISPIGLALFQMFPAPNTTGPNSTVGGYITAPSNTQFATTMDFRVDHHFNSNNTFYVRYSYNPVSTFTAPWLPNVTIGGTSVSNEGGQSFPGYNTETAQGIALHYLHTITPSLILELASGYTRLNLQSNTVNLGTNASQKLGIPNVNIDAANSGLSPVTSSYAALGDAQYLPIIDINNVFQYQGTLTWTRGNHNIKVGGSWIRRQLQYYQANAGEGVFNFGGAFPGNFAAATANPPSGQSTVTDPRVIYNGYLYNGVAGSASNMITGQTTSITRQNPNGLRFGLRTSNPYIFLMDDWHATKRLTINAGLRWEYMSPITEVNNKRANLVLSRLTGSPDSVSPFVLASNSDRAAGVSPDFINFAPRFGFAFDMGRGLVVRGAGGISYYGFTGVGPTNLVNPPNYFNFSCSYGRTDASACLSGPNGPLGTIGAGLPTPTFGTNTINGRGIAGSITAMDPNYRQPYIEQWNLTVQKAIAGNVFTATYIGQQGRREGTTVPLNRPAPSNPIKPLPYATLLPNVSSVNFYTSEGYSRYNAAIVVYERRMSHGLAVNANYTYARGLNNLGDSGLGGTFGLVAANPRYDYGNSDIDLRHRLAITGTYVLQYGKNFSGIKKQAIAGWQANTIYYIQSGAPFNISSSASSPALIGLPGVNSDRPNKVPGQKLTQAFSYDAATIRNNVYLNPNAFTPQTVGTPGYAGRNQVYGPKSRELDLSITKNFQIQERWQLQFRAESFNLTNTANFANPGGGISNWTSPATFPNQPSGVVNLAGSSFGKISSTLLGSNPRNMQFALKLSF